MASRPGTPDSDSTGVAIDEPPTPKKPVNAPTRAPATTNSAHGATDPGVITT